MLSSLLILAWIGATIDNLLLSYIGTLALAFYPGLSYNGMLDQVREIVKHFETHLKSILPKSKDE